MFRVKGVHGVYCDAVVKDTFGYAVFVSLIGNDSSIQELAGKLSLSSKSEHSIQTLELDVGEDKGFTFNGTQLSQKNAQRLPDSSKFKGLHVFWSSKKLLPQFTDSGCGYVMFDDKSMESNEAIDERIWQTIKQVSKVPLLESWKSVILSESKESEWVKPMDSIGKINAFEISLPSFEELAERVTSLVQSGVLQK